MANKQLVDFIKNSLARNIPMEETKKVLLENKWPEKEIDDAIASLNSPQSNPVSSQPKPESPAKNSANPFSDFKPDKPASANPASSLAQPSSPKQQVSQSPLKQQPSPVNFSPAQSLPARPPSSNPPFAEFKTFPHAVKPLPQFPVSSPSRPLGMQPSKKPEPKSNKSGKKSIMLVAVGGGVVLVIAIILISVFMLANSGKISDEKFLSGTAIDIKAGKQATFNFDGQEHSITLNFIQGNSVDITVQSNPVNARLSTGEVKKFNINADEFYDVMISLNFINENKANLNVKQIHERVCTENWECTDWNNCSNSMQSRICTDANECGTDKGKPEESQECVMPPSCTELGGTLCTSSQNCTGNTTTSVEGECCLEVCEENEIFCADLSGTLCTSSQTCNGTIETTSDGECCMDTCEEIEILCVDDLGGEICGENYACNGTIETTSDGECCLDSCEEITV